MKFSGHLFIFLVIVPPCSASQQGCCSYHRGICGNTCCDGTPLSSVCRNDNEISNLKADCQSEAKISINIEQYSEYVSEAEQLFFQDSFSQHSEIYIRARVFDLFELAERELQYALEKTMEKECRNSIKVAIMVIREAQSELAKEKRSFESAIKTTIQNRQVILGMTKANVKDSWGNADNIKTINYFDGDREVWKYKKFRVMGSRPVVYLYFKKLPYFENDVLIQTIPDHLN